MRPYYQQRETDGQQNYFIFFTSGTWLLNDVLGENSGFLRNRADTARPPAQGWEWGDGTSWRTDDNTIKLEMKEMTPCTEVEVQATGEAATAQSLSLGTYLPTGSWVSGRPVYMKEGGGRFLLVPEAKVSWQIMDTIANSGSYIQSGRGTLSPGQVEAGPSERNGKMGWVYWNNGQWRDSAEKIRVTCKQSKSCTVCRVISTCIPRIHNHHPQAPVARR
jgi:hypothetical protein